jgi:hypothetical protein
MFAAFSAQPVHAIVREELERSLALVTLGVKDRCTHTSADLNASINWDFS